VCGGGGHYLTFAQLGIEEAAEKLSVKSVEEKVIVGLIIVFVNSFITWDQNPEKLSFIQIVVKKHNYICDASAWYKTDYGYVCSIGGHEVTSAELEIEEAAERLSV